MMQYLDESLLFYSAYPHFNFSSFLSFVVSYIRKNSTWFFPYDQKYKIGSARIKTC